MPACALDLKTACFDATSSGSKHATHDVSRITASPMTSYLQAEILPARNTGAIRLYDAAAYAGMRTACQLTARCLDDLAELVKPGTTTEEIDAYVFKFALDNGALPATLNYRGYMKSVCTSINHVVCHGIPDEKPLR